MMKYNLFASENDDLVRLLSSAVDETGRSEQPSAMFGPSVYIILYRDVDLTGKGVSRREFRGMAQLTSSWQPLEWQNSVFKFPHRGALHAHWIFCREFDAPDWLRVPTSDGMATIDQLQSGDQIPKTVGDEIFHIFRDTPAYDKSNESR